jgi:WD40 repeat protein
MLLVNISCCCFSCEGALLASGSADCTVKLWDVASSTKTLKTEDVYVWYVKILIHSSIHLILLLWLQNTLVFFSETAKAAQLTDWDCLKLSLQNQLLFIACRWEISPLFSIIVFMVVLCGENWRICGFLAIAVFSEEPSICLWRSLSLNSS